MLEELGVALTEGADWAVFEVVGRKAVRRAVVFGEGGKTVKSLE